ncbi:MAG: hypothetical protein DMG33_16950 [Acidobacteria bacterium]|nr:MAG: hypothetical protein DMG33_16950 [Acidobacteriota bacterium]
MDPAYSALVYAGFLACLVGFVSLLRPLKFLRISSRYRGPAVFGRGLLLILGVFSLPAKETWVQWPHALLDEFVAVYQFEEFHAIRVHAPRERVFQAIKEVRADEIFLFRTLTWIRRFGRPGPESILNAPENMPLLEVATKTSFLLLAEEPDREIVLGTLVAAPPGWRPKGKPTSAAFRAFDEPGFARDDCNHRNACIRDGCFDEKEICGVLAHNLSRKRADSRDVAARHSTSSRADVSLRRAP